MVSWAAFNNVSGIDPQLVDPENGDYRVTPGSPAEGYGCQIFPNKNFHDLLLDCNKKYISKTFAKRSSIEVSGIINENTIWQSDTVRVVGNVIVNNNVILEIQKGTKVEFQDFYTINVHGCIQALGTSDQRILFTSAHPELFEPDSSTSGAWNGIRFNATSSLNEKSVFKYCDFEYSKSFGDSMRGGVISFYDYSKCRIENCSFTFNVADFGGALGFDYHSSPDIVGCTFMKNYAFLGGSPIYCAYSYPRLINNTIIDNYVLNDDINYRTAAIQTFISKPIIKNNIIWDNVTSYFDPGQLIECKDFYTQYNDIEFGHGGLGNIDDDPLFYYSGEYPYSLLQFSPCIDAGTSDTIGLMLPLFDYTGNDRIYDGRIDMGAFEWSGYWIDNEIQTEQPITVHPNPFSTWTCIKFKNNEVYKENTEIKIYNIKGQVIRTISNHTSSLSDLVEVTWDGKDDMGRCVGSGIYLFKLNGIGENVGKIIKLE